ncbi:MAG: MFS transporter [Acidimicrobiales bacterium]
MTSAEQSTSKAASPVSRHAWKILGATSLTNFVAGLDLSMVNVAVPDIQETFPTASTADVSWVLTFYMLSYAGFLITAGRIADRIGRLRVLNTGLLCFVAGAGLAVVAPSLPLLIAARGVMGLGVAMMAPASLGLAVAAWPPERRATAVAVWSSTLALSSAVGPVIGALLIEASSWRLAFALNIPIGLLALLWGRRVLVESAKDPDARTPDAVGAVLLGLATAGLALAIVQGRDWGWASPAIIGLFVLTVVCIATVIPRTASHPNPIVPRSLLAVSSFRVATVSVFLFGLGFFATFLTLVLYLTEIADYSTVRAGFAIIMLPITATIVANISGRLADRYGHRTIAIPGMFMFTLGALWIRANAGPDPSYMVDLLPGLILMGLGIGAGPTILVGAGVSEVNPVHFSLAGAVTQTARQLSGAIGVAILVAILGSADTATVASFQRGFLYLATVTALACIVATRLPARPKTTTT